MTALLTILLLISWITKDSEASLNETSSPKCSLFLDDYRYAEENSYRISTAAIPTRYQLQVEPLVNENKFNGHLKLNATWEFKSDVIKLNADPELKISHCDVRIVQLGSDETEDEDPSMDVSIVKTVEQSQENPWYSIHLNRKLAKGSVCEVEIVYTGDLLSCQFSSFFRNTYTQSVGNTLYSSYYIGAYLRLYHVREMFPCIVNPSHKATFKLAIMHPRNMTARSNMPLETSIEVAEQPDMIWSHFEETPQMVSYQLALIVSEFQSIEPTKEVNEKNGKKVEVKVWTRESYLETYADLPDKIVTIINYLQDYLDRPIALPKLDVVVVPNCAIENSDSWGLMIVKEGKLSGPSIWDTAHQLAYQWIGQYITICRMSDLQNNKILNSFLATMITLDISSNELEGTWPMTTLYSLNYEFGKTMPFSRVAGIRSGARLNRAELILRMFNYTLGKDLFQKGVRKFIENSEKKGRVFLSDDIYNGLDDVVNGTDILPPGLTIESIVIPWIARDRIPLVTVSRDYETGNVTFSQKIYMRDAPPPSSIRATYYWDIPIIVKSEDNLDFSKFKPIAWMTKESKKNLTITNITDKNNFIIVNPEEIGMFPVNYDIQNWDMLSQYLQGPNREKIPVLTRAKLLHDAWNLAYAGELRFSIALNMTLFLKQERNHVVWAPVFTMIDHIGRRIEGSDVYTKFQAYIRNLLKPLYFELGTTPQPDEPWYKTNIRGFAKHFLCWAGYEPCVKEAREQYEKWLTDEEPDKGNPVANEFICPVFKWGTQEEWEFGLQRVINFDQTERSPSERTYLLKTLASCPIDSYKIERLLNVTILDQNEIFTSSDIHLIYGMLTTNAVGYTTLFKFLSNHWQTIKQRFENKTHLWQGILNSATSSFTTLQGYRMVSTLYANRQEEFKSEHIIIEKVLENIMRKATWSQQNLPEIDAWLRENLSKEELDTIEINSSTTELVPFGG